MTKHLELENKHLNLIVNSQSTTIKALLENVSVLDVLLQDTITILRKMEDQLISYEDATGVYINKINELKDENRKLSIKVASLENAFAEDEQYVSKLKEEIERLNRKVRNMQSF